MLRKMYEKLYEALYIKKQNTFESKKPIKGEIYLEEKATFTRKGFVESLQKKEKRVFKATH